MTQMPPIPNEMMLTVTLQAQEWNWLIDILVNTVGSPYRVTAPLIGKISQQTQEHAGRQMQGSPPTPLRVVEGEDRPA